MLTKLVHAENAESTPLYASLSPIHLEEFVYEQRALLTAGDETLVDIKLQVEGQMMPISFLIICFSSREFYTIAGSQSVSRLALGCFSCDVQPHEHERGDERRRPDQRGASGGGASARSLLLRRPR